MDMDYTVYRFPTEEDGVALVEEKLCELMVKYRDNQESLDTIEIDYMDWANTIMLSAKSQ
jgi:hypothetical protein